MVNILHVTNNATNARTCLEEFHKANPQGKVKMREGVVETFSVRHYFRKIKDIDGAQKLAGINFNSIMFWGMPPSQEVKQWLWSRLREPAKKEGSLTLSIPSKEEV